MADAQLSTVTSPSRVVSANTWPGGRALTTNPLATAPGLNLDECVGQRQATWTFTLIDGITGQRLGELNPVKQPATITHDTSRTIKRDLRLALGVADRAAIDPIRDRILPYMHLAGAAYPLGRYLFTDPTSLVSTGGDHAICTLLDEMFLIDQQLEHGFSADGDDVSSAVRQLLTGITVPRVLIDPTAYAAVGGWAAGTTRGQTLAALALQGSYETPWMDNDGVFRMITTVDPDAVPAALDFDIGRRLVRGSIGKTQDILNAPNRFIVIGNSGSSEKGEIIGSYDVPPNAPHSISNRGFVVPFVTPMQIASSVQAAATARSIGLRSTIFERADLETPPDPRHDSYDVIRWQGRNWVELAWSMTCEEGGSMRHSLRRALLR